MATGRTELTSADGGDAVIVRLVYQRQWSRLRHLLIQLGDSVIPFDDLCDRSTTRDLFVHFVCRFQAPSTIVRIAAKTFPESLKCSDALGRFPIHIACAWGASTDTISFLICSYPAAASIQDDEGKAPIHHLCKSFQLNYRGTSRMPVKESMMSIVNMLKTAAPNSFNLEDNEEMNAVEYAIDSKTDINVIKALQRACRDDWRQMKKETHASHKELELDLQKIQTDLRSQHLASSGSNLKTLVGKSASGVSITGLATAMIQSARVA